MYKNVQKVFFPFGIFLDGFSFYVLIYMYNDKYITQGVFLNAMVLSVGQLDIYKDKGDPK